MKSFLAAAVVWAVAGCSAGDESKTGQPYPYPECQAVVDWLKDNSGEPNSLEIIAWERWEPFAGCANITVKYRGKSQFGGYQVNRVVVHVIGSKATSQWEAPDLPIVTK